MNHLFKRPDTSINLFDDVPEASYTLPGWMYYDAATFEDEKRTIFWKSWSHVGHVSELEDEGAYLTAEIAGQGIFVIRGSDGDLRAFFNTCQHRGHSLLKGKGRAKNLIVCPYHSWSYDHTGALRAAPNSEQVKDFDKACFGLAPVRIELFAGFVFVNLDAEAPAMAEVYPGAELWLRDNCPAITGLTPTDAVLFDIKGNWKNVGDNFLECYHCSTTHKAFVDLVDMSTYQVETKEHWSVQKGQCRADNTAYDFVAGGKDDADFFALYLWPALAFVKFPGTPGIATFSFLPLESEITRQTFIYHAVNGVPTDTESNALAYFRDVLGPEDVNLVEDVQRGLHSLGYHQGRFMIDAVRSAVSEHAVHHFHGLVHRALVPVGG